MKLCHIVPSLAEEHGGPSKSVRALCAAFGDQGHEVELLTTHSGPAISNTAGKLAISAFPRDWPQRFCPSSSLARHVRAAQYDIIHHHSVWLRTLHYASTSARRQRARLVISPRGMMTRWAWRHHSWRKAFARQLIHPGAFESAAAWHVTSREEGQELRKLGFQQPICVAPNGVELPTAEEIDAAGRYWRQICPAIEQDRVALFYSRFHLKKRVLELIDLWLERAPPGWLLLLVGIPQDYTPEMLEAYALRMSAAGRIRAFSGLGAPPPYAVASLFVLPSHSENFGMAVAEAMAHGVPAVVTDTTPWSAVNQHEFGWCVPWDRFGAALEQATSQPPESLSEKGARAREWVAREFSWQQSAQQLGAFYDALCRGQPWPDALSA